MKFHCDSCDTDKDFQLDYGMMIVSFEKKTTIRVCRQCKTPKAGVPDVYWDGKPEENLADGPDGKPRVFFSKGEKAAYLKSRGLMEAGDRVHGAPVQIHQNQQRKIDTRHEVKEALRKVAQMGKDRRRQEYLRIIKQRQGGQYA